MHQPKFYICWEYCKRGGVGGNMIMSVRQLTTVSTYRKGVGQNYSEEIEKPTETYKFQA